MTASEDSSSLNLDVNTTGTCEINGVFYNTPAYPSAHQFYEGLGGYAIALYVTATATVLVLAIQYIILTKQFLKNVPPKRRVGTQWINSVYLVASVMGLLGIVTPKSSDFVWLCYRVYLGMVMTYFVELTIAWHGGPQEMLNRLRNCTINLRGPPCCCCICCLPKAKPCTRKTLQMLRRCVTQVAYVHTIMVFLLAVLSISGDLKIGNMSPLDPYLYISVILLISFLIGLWALFALFRMEATYDFLHVYQYTKKARLLKAMITLSNLQGFLIDSLAIYDVIPCVGPLISSKAMGSIIKSILIMAETLSMGSFMFKSYMSDTERI